jgi:hypothetical protein
MRTTGNKQRCGDKGEELFHLAMLSSVFGVAAGAFRRTWQQR